MPPSSARRRCLHAPRLAASATRSDRDLLRYDARPMGLFVYGSLFESVLGSEQCHTYKPWRVYLINQIQYTNLYWTAS